MLGFTDFLPKFTPGFLSSRSESLQTVLKDANHWINEHNVNVVNVETVVLPNIHQGGEEGPEDSALRVSGDFSNTWHQFVRVWYKY